ncbi:MAG: hypothetical protein JJT94_14185 [Bernardetiaceae bacterium]|nr:hypothetical protein [Bernardetiaceae bacterium]
MYNFFLVFLLLFFFTVSFSYSQEEQISEDTVWNFSILYGIDYDLEMYINDIHVLTLKEFGEFYNDPLVNAFGLNYTIKDLSDSILIESLYGNYPLKKKIKTPKNILKKSYKITFIRPNSSRAYNYKYEVVVELKHGRYIAFANNPGLKGYEPWFFQSRLPFRDGPAYRTKW